MSAHTSHSHRGNGPKALLERADRLLVEAGAEESAVDRFLTSYLAALRGAAAIIAVAVPSTTQRRRGTGGAWQTMARVAPEFTMWSDYFAEYSALRAAIMSGVSRPMPMDRAEEFFRRVTAFLHDVEDHLGASGRLPVDGRWTTGGNMMSGGLTA